MKKQWSTVFFVLLTLVVVIFAVLNVEPVAINFGFVMVETPLAVILIATLLIGVLMAVLLSTAIILKYKSEEKKLNKEIIAIEEEKEAEKENLVQQHEVEIQSLIEKNERSEKEIRNLNRLIKNMDASDNIQTEE